MKVSYKLGCEKAVKMTCWKVAQPRAVSGALARLRIAAPTKTRGTANKTPTTCKGPYKIKSQASRGFVSKPQVVRYTLNDSVLAMFRPRLHLPTNLWRWGES